MIGRADRRYRQDLRTVATAQTTGIACRAAWGNDARDPMAGTREHDGTLGAVVKITNAANWAHSAARAPTARSRAAGRQPHPRQQAGSGTVNPDRWVRSCVWT